jgi:hypothetical protein
MFSCMWLSTFRRNVLSLSWGKSGDTFLRNVSICLQETTGRHVPDQDRHLHRCENHRMPVEAVTQGFAIDCPPMALVWPAYILWYRLNVQCLRLCYVMQPRTTTVIQSYLKTSVFISYYSRCSFFVPFFLFSFILCLISYLYLWAWLYSILMYLQRFYTIMYLLRFSFNTSRQDLHTTHTHITHSGPPLIQQFYFIITKTTDIKHKSKNIQTKFWRSTELCNEWACDTTAPFD